MEAKGPTRRDLPEKLVKELLSRTANRSRVVVEHILEHGYITTADLEARYKHAPRAARDVRERGIPLVTVNVTIAGRRMASYRFPDEVELDRGRSGRAAISKAFRTKVLDAHDHRDAFTSEQLSARMLQIDHRVPFEVGGDPEAPYKVEDWMPVTAELNRAKSWECENCPNFTAKAIDVCMSCYWAVPDGEYAHVATRQMRRADVLWTDGEVESFDRLRAWAEEQGLPVAHAIKHVVENCDP